MQTYSIILYIIIKAIKQHIALYATHEETPLCK